MQVSRRAVGVALIGSGACLMVGPALLRLFAQEQAPSRAEVTIVAKDYHFSPDRIEVGQDDLVKVTIRSEDVAHSFSIDEYRIVKRIPAGGSTTFEFRADRGGTFQFYCNLSNDPGHGQMKGTLVVRSSK
jgi:heme/copper-type cytochrome/quinol oxidase subunit 2